MAGKAKPLLPSRFSSALRRLRVRSLFLSCVREALGRDRSARGSFIRYAIAFKLPVGIPDVRCVQVKAKQACAKAGLFRIFVRVGHGSNADILASLAMAIAEDHSQATTCSVW